MIQGYFPIFPAGAKVLNNNLACIHEDDRILFYNAAGPIYGFDEDDQLGGRIAQGMLIDLKLTTPTALATVLGVDQSTVHRNRQKYQTGGIDALKDRRGEHGPYKLTGHRCDNVQKLIDEGVSIRKAAGQEGVSEGAIRYAIKKGLLKKRGLKKEEQTDTGIKGPAVRSREDQECEGGLGAKRDQERLEARVGVLEEAPVRFEPVEGVQKAGVLIALPALLTQGLLDVGKKIYGRLQNGFFGLQSVLVTLTFMALLRVKTPEQLKGHNPGELGILLGLDRVPEVKTLRRKIREIGRQEKAREFAAAFTRYWADEVPEALGFLYIDGHVRPYNGRKHKLPKTHVARRRLCMPATTDFWVNDTNAEPLLFVTAEANNSLLSILDQKILPEIRSLVDNDRRLTIIFDREGWSPKFFQKWVKEGYDVLTYRKGNYDPWPEECFFEVESSMCSKKVVYKLGQRSVQIRKNFWMREVRRLCDTGHQTSIMTTRQDLPLEEIAYRMFSRWKQENFFRYMRREYNFDHLCTYDVEKADPNRLVPNPARKEKVRQLDKLKKELADCRNEYGKAAIDNQESMYPTMRGFKIAHSKEGQKIRQLEKLCGQIETEVKSLPKKVPLNELMNEDEIVKLEEERKIFTDTIKMISYRAETSLFNMIRPFFARHEDEGRAFLKSLFQNTADILPDYQNGRLLVRFHTMANQRSNRILRSLCRVINQENCFYPGTELRMTFEAA